MDDAQNDSSAPHDDAVDQFGSDLAIVLDQHGAIVAVAGSNGAVLGGSARAGRRLVDYVHPDDRGPLLEAIARGVDAPTFDLLVRCRHADGSWRTLEASTLAGGDETLVFVGTDVTDRVLAEAEVGVYEALVGTWHDSVPLGVAHDAVARMVEAAVPTARTALYARREDDFELVAAPQLGGPWTRVAFRLPGADYAGATPGTLDTAPARMVALASDAGVGFAWVMAVPGVDAEVGGLIVVFVGEKRFVTIDERAGLERCSRAFERVLTAEVRAAAERRRATTDVLTGAATRAVALEALATADGSASVLLVRVDGLAEINARHGLEAGDAVLAQVGAGLHGGGRQRDLVARLSGSTFVVVGSGRAGGRDPGPWVDRLREQLLTPVLAGGTRLVPECRIAVADGERDESGLQTLARAEALLRGGENLHSGTALGDR